MRARLTASQTVNKLLLEARKFYREHRSEPGIGSSFGYFTEHPVAPLNRKRLILLLKSLQKHSETLKRPLRILDIACGGGIVSSAAARMGHSVLGMDLNPGELEWAKSFATEIQKSGDPLILKFETADLLSPNTLWESNAEKLLGGKPDVVILAYALHHFKDTDAILNRLSRWLDSSAMLLVNEENPLSPLFRLKHRLRGWLQKDTDVEWHKSLTEWTRALELHGFHVEQRPHGADFIPGLSTLAPASCWSLVFGAYRDIPSG